MKTISFYSSMNCIISLHLQRMIAFQISPFTTIVKMNYCCLTFQNKTKITSAIFYINNFKSKKNKHCNLRCFIPSQFLTKVDFFNETCVTHCQLLSLINAALLKWLSLVLSIHSIKIITALPSRQWHFKMNIIIKLTP